MQEHYLKINSEMLYSIQIGHKTAEFRRCDDRDFQCGDTLVLSDGHSEERVFVTHIVRGPAFNIPAGFAMLSFNRDKSHYAEAIDALDAINHIGSIAGEDCKPGENYVDAVPLTRALGIFYGEEYVRVSLGSRAEEEPCAS